MTRRSLVGILGGLALALANAGATTSATHPTIVAGTHPANAAIPAGQVADIATLDLPSGAWFVTTKAVVSGIATSFGQHLVSCQLVAGGDVDSVSVNPFHAGSAASRVPVLLTVVHRFSAPGEARLRCLALTANTAVIGLISIIAVKAGTLTNGTIGFAGTTTGSGTPRIIAAFRDAAVNTEPNQLSPIQELPLPQGRWLVVAKAVVSGGNSGNFVSSVHCQMAGGSGPDAAADTGHFELAPTISPGSFAVVGLQVVATIGSSGGKAIFACSSQVNDHTFSWLKLTAIKLGKVTIQPLDGTASTTTGSGAPRVIHGGLNALAPMSLPTSYTTVESLSLPTGKWLVSGKLVLSASGGSGTVAIDCQLALGGATDDSRLRMTGGLNSSVMWFQVVTSMSVPSVARLRCKRNNAGWTFQI